MEQSQPPIVDLLPRQPFEKLNPFQRLWGVIVSPVRTFADIIRLPDSIVPLIVITLVTVFGSAVMTPRIDFETSIRADFEKRGMSEQDQERAFELISKIQRFTTLLSALSVPLVLVALAGFCLLLFRLAGWEKGTFLQIFSVTTYSWLPQVIKGIILTALVYPRESVPVERLPVLLRSNPGFLADPAEQPVVSSFLASIDVFNIWTLALMTIGFSLASGKSRAASTTMVLVVFLIYLLGKLALAAIGGAG